MSDLHETITARIERLDALANAAIDAVGDSPWRVNNDGSWMVETADDSRHTVATEAFEEVAEYLAALDPATVLRGLAEDRDILARHTANAGIGHCWHDAGWVQWPCGEIRSLARRHGIEVPS